MPDISVIVSSRLSESRGEFEWIVLIEPSWPVFMAWSMSSASATTTLTDHDAVGAHTQRVADEVADRDLTLALDVRRARFQADHVRLLQLQLGGILDRDDALVVGDEGRQHVQAWSSCRRRSRPTP